MSSTITVTATVQDPSGTSLAGNCYLRFRLRNFAGFVPQVSGTSIMPEIQVDAVPVNGAISQTLWPNNAITPSTTFYTAELWNNGRITSSGNYIFNVNTSLNSAAQVNTPPVPAGFSLVLENNGALNSSQSTLNVQSADASVTITDLGSGNIDFKAAVGAQSGANIAPLTQVSDSSGNFAFPGATLTSINLGGSTKTLAQFLPGNSLMCSPSKWKATISTFSASTTVTMQVVKCTPGTGNVLATANVTFGGLTSPTLSPAGLYTSDAISFSLNPAFDYYFLINSSTGLLNIAQTGTAQSGQAGGCYGFASNQLSPSTLTFSGGTLQAGKNFVTSLVVA